MKTTRLLSLLLGVAVSASAFVPADGPKAKPAKQTKAQVMILGSYHMGNPGADISNMQADDVRTPERQQ
jgi:hypothetical protein